MKVKDILKIDKPKMFANKIMYDINYEGYFNAVTNDINEMTIMDARMNLYLVREYTERLLETLDKIEKDM